jgi:agmatinase
MITNFGGLEPQYESLENATFVIVPVPYDLTSTYQSGARRGPSAILEASGNMELFDEELGKETFRCGIHTADFLEVNASGPEAMVYAVREKIHGIVSLKKIPVMLGGEHSLSPGAVEAVREQYPDLSVLHFDAHADLRDDYQGSPYSHACAGRRMSELCPLVQVGIRSLSAEEAAFMKEASVKTFFAHSMFRDPNWINQICESLHDDIYITIDLDVLDPAFMPATGTPEPGGLSWQQLLEIIRTVSTRCRVRGLDVVELAPIPGLVAPDFLAAKLIYRIMGYLTP